MSSPARPRQRRLAYAASAVVLVAATATGIVALGRTGTPGGVRASTSAYGEVVRGVRAGVNENTLPLSPDYRVVASEASSCRARQIRVRLATVSANRSPVEGWSGVIWLENVGARCSLPETDIGLQPVGGSDHLPIGASSASDAVARVGFVLAHDQWASATATLAATNTRTPGARSSTLGQLCAPRPADALVLLGYETRWPDYRFALPRAVDVCTRDFVTVSGGLVRPSPRGLR